MAGNTENDMAPRVAPYIQRVISHRRATSAMPRLGASGNEPSIPYSEPDDAAKMTDESAHPSRPTLTQDYNSPRPKSSTSVKDKFHPSRSLGSSWEYYRSDAELVQSTFQIPPLRKTGLGGEKSRSFGDAQYQSSSPGSSRPENEQKLGISKVQMVFERTPLSFEDSLGPQSGHITPASTVKSPKPLSPHKNGVPKYVSAFEYAMRPFLESSVDDDYEHHLHLPPREEDSHSESGPSPPFLPTQNDGDYHYDTENESEEVFDWGVPEKLLEDDGFRTRIRQVQLQTYLMHCTVLQNTVRELQHTPWIRDASHSTIWYYEKMRSLAYRARQIAEMLESRDLKARCEYWAGRACGGTQDYETAESHFKAALLHDAENGVKNNGDVQLRGLRPSEKADVRFLRDSCKARHRHYERKREQVLRLSERNSWETGLPIAACLGENMVPSPPWVPDRDRVVQLARHKYDGKKVPDEQAWLLMDDKLGQTLEDQAQAQWKAEDEIVQAMHRRTLSREEWWYIKRDATAAQQHRFQGLPDQAMTFESELHKHVLKYATVASSQSSGAPDSAFSDSPPYEQLRLADDGTTLNIGRNSLSSVAHFTTTSRPRLRNLEEELGGCSGDSSPLPEPVSSRASPGVSPRTYLRSDWNSPRFAEYVETTLNEQEIGEAAEQLRTKQILWVLTNVLKRRRGALSPVSTDGIRAQTHFGSAMQGEVTGENKGINTEKRMNEHERWPVVEVKFDEAARSTGFSDAAVSTGNATTSFKLKALVSTSPTTPATPKSTSSLGMLAALYSSPILRRAKSFSPFPLDAPLLAQAALYASIIFHDETTSHGESLPHIIHATGPTNGSFPSDKEPADPISD